MSLTDIGRALGVSRFVVRKAIGWLKNLERERSVTPSAPDRALGS